MKGRIPSQTDTARISVKDLGPSALKRHYRMDGVTVKTAVESRVKDC